VNWKESAAAVRWNIQPFINGSYRTSTSTECFDNINPARKRVCAAFRSEARQISMTQYTLPASASTTAAGQNYCRFGVPKSY